MVFQHAAGTVVAAVVAGALLAGCGATVAGSAGNIPTATLPGGPPSTGESDRSAPSGGAGGWTGAAPTVPDPVDTQTFTRDVCATLSEAKLSELGLYDTTPREGPTGPTCNWNFVESDTSRVDISAMELNPNGLSDIYDQQAEFGYFEPTEVAGHPAAYASIVDHRGGGDCSLWVGINDQFAVSVSTSLGTGIDDSRSCAIAEEVATAMVDTLKER